MISRISNNMIYCRAISKTTGERCRRNPLQGKKYCKDHIPKVDLTNIWHLLAILSVILTIVTFIVAIRWGPDIYNWFLGYKLEVDFKENSKDIVIRGGKEAIAVEIKNKGGYDLNNVYGNVSFYCKQGLKYESGNVEFEEGRDTLSKNSKSELLYFYNDTLINFMKNDKYKCADANFLIVGYNKVGDTIAKKIGVKSFEFFNDIDEIRLVEYELGDDINQNLCVYCNITVNIGSSDVEESFIGKEFHKYPFLLAKFSSFPDYIEVSPEVVDSFVIIGSNNLDYKPCYGKSIHECVYSLCGEVSNKFGFNLKCDIDIGLIEISMPKGSNGTCNIPLEKIELPVKDQCYLEN